MKDIERRTEEAAPTEVLLARHMARRGAHWPEFSAAVLTSRARRGIDTAALAAALGVPDRLVASAERGDLSPRLAPPQFDAVLPEVDWQALGLPPSRVAAGDPMTGRHPAGRRKGHMTI